MMKRIFTNMWKKSKISYYIGLKSVGLLIASSTVRLGSTALFFIRRLLENTERHTIDFDTTQIKEAAAYAHAAFEIETVEQFITQYEDGYGHTVLEIDNVRIILYQQDDTTHISVRGSSNPNNWEHNVLTELRYDSQLGADVHFGFSTLTKEILKHIEPLCQKKVTITGFSLGGAVSILMGWYLSKLKYDVQNITAIGSPKISDFDYSHLPVVTVINKLDPVTYLPAFTPLHRYRHQGCRIVLDADGWWLYDDTWKADLLLSWVLIDRRLDIGQHVQYMKNMESL